MIKIYRWVIQQICPFKPLNFKYCSKCDEIKLISEFSKNKSMSSGYNYSCKSCSNLNWIKKYKNKSK
jgi:hypothetical protein